MKIRSVLYVMGNLLLLLGSALMIPCLVALVTDLQPGAKVKEAPAFLGTALLSAGVGLGARYIFRDAAGQVRAREGFLIVGLAWVMISTVGMLPYLLVGATSSVTDAFFETMSGFTTTGASVFASFESIPPALMFWRCMTQWLGGMGIVVLSIALFPTLGVGGYRLLKAEAPGGVAYERERPRMTDTAKELWRIYIVLSAVLVLLLMVSGMGPYDAVCHAFTTMSTGGFSNRIDSVAYYSSAFTQWIIIFFMFLAGMNFSLYANALRRDWRALVRNTEWRSYVLVTLLAGLFGIVLLAPSGMGEKTVRDSFFQVISVMTTTGYATADYDAWPHALRLTLFLLMFCGGCMGSTAGGMKVARFVIYIKALAREIHRLLFPHAVRSIRLSKRVIPEPMVYNVFAFGFIFVAAFCLGSMTMALSGYDLETSISASVAALGNIGPGLGEVGPTANWSHLPLMAKWVMSLLMLCGRLEMFSFLVLMSPWLWRR